MQTLFWGTLVKTLFWDTFARRSLKTRFVGQSCKSRLDEDFRWTLVPRHFCQDAFVKTQDKLVRHPCQDTLLGQPSKAILKTLFRHTFVKHFLGGTPQRHSRKKAPFWDTLVGRKTRKKLARFSTELLLDSAVAVLEDAVFWRTLAGYLYTRARKTLFYDTLRHSRAVSCKAPCRTLASKISWRHFSGAPL